MDPYLRTLSWWKQTWWQRCIQGFTRRAECWMWLPIHVPGPARHPEISPPTYKHSHNGPHYGAHLVGAARNLGWTSTRGSQVAEKLEVPWRLNATPFKPNPPVKKPGPRSSSKGEDGTASHESKPDAFLSSSFWWSYSHIPGEWFLTWWFLKKSCFGHSWFAYIQISENSSSHVLPEKKPRGTFHSTQ